MCEEHNIPKVYDPASVEKKWYKFWEEHRYFHAEVEEGKDAFSIVIPPPNITGQLHMGHALDNTLQDILIRWHRMMGHNTLWMPGYDHAGLATQIKVEEVIKKEEGKTRYDLGREEFLKRVWEWKAPKEAPIRNACSCVNPYISAKAATTDCEQLYPLLKSSTAFCILSSINYFAFLFRTKI